LRTASGMRHNGKPQQGVENSFETRRKACEAPPPETRQRCPQNSSPTRHKQSAKTSAGTPGVKVPPHEGDFGPPQRGGEEVSQKTGVFERTPIVAVLNTNGGKNEEKQ